MHSLLARDIKFKFLSRQDIIFFVADLGAPRHGDGVPDGGRDEQHVREPPQERVPARGPAPPRHDREGALPAHQGEGAGEE